jgi:hypothetical protein
MRGAITPLPQYAFMVWCSVKKGTGTNLLLPSALKVYWGDGGIHAFLTSELVRGEW